MLKLRFCFIVSLLFRNDLVNARHVNNNDDDGSSSSQSSELHTNTILFHHTDDILFPNVTLDDFKHLPVFYPGEHPEHSRNSDATRRRNNKRRGKREQRLCEKKYDDYIKIIFPNDEDFIADANDSEFNGRNLSTPGEFPHMTAIGFPTEFGNATIDYKCGGSLISEKFVITAAHCTRISGENPTKVSIGDLNLMMEERYVEPQIRNIKQIYNHPNYDSTSYYNDLALLELDGDVEFTEFVRPIRLWITNDIPVSVAYAMGYGATSFATARTNRLTDFNLTIVPNDECRAKMPDMPELERGVIDSQICAFDYVLKRDTCQGDSGGPLQLNLQGRRRRNRKHYHLIGITSFGVFCRSDYPGVYTRVSSFLEWIENIVWK